MFNFKKGNTEATSFTKLTLRLSGMRSTEEYEIVCQGETSECAQYLIFYSKDGDRRKLEKSVQRPTDMVLELLNRCSVMRWDGFSGSNPRGVRDGWMFTLTAEINGEKIYASGSNNYPRHYREFMDGFKTLLSDEEIQ